MKLLVLALCLVSVALGGTLQSRSFFPTNQTVTRDVDGGDGEFTAACALRGYYEFNTDSLVADSETSSAQMIAHFYQRGTNCLVDYIFVSWILSSCDTLEGSPVTGNTFQSFGSLAENNLGFNLVALSQSDPVIFVETNCCVDDTMMKGVQVDDLNAAAFQQCYAYNKIGCSCKS